MLNGPTEAVESRAFARPPLGSPNSFSMSGARGQLSPRLTSAGVLRADRVRQNRLVSVPVGRCCTSGAAAALGAAHLVASRCGDGPATLACGDEDFAMRTAGTLRTTGGLFHPLNHGGSRCQTLPAGTSDVDSSIGMRKDVFLKTEYRSDRLRTASPVDSPGRYVRVRQETLNHPDVDTAVQPAQADRPT